MRRVNIFIIIFALFLSLGCAALKPHPPTITKDYLQDNNYPCYRVNFHRKYELKEILSHVDDSGYAKGYLFEKYTNKIIIYKAETKRGIWKAGPLSTEIYDKKIIYSKDNKNISGVLNLEKTKKGYMLRVFVANRISDNYYVGVLRYFPLLGANSDINLDEAVELVKDEKYSIANGIKDKKKLVDYYINNIKKIKCPDKEE